MKYIIVSIFLLIASFPSFSQNSHAIKKAKLTVIVDDKFPYNIDRLKDGDNSSVRESINKDILIKGSINLVEISWSKLKSSPNPLTNSIESSYYFYLKKGNGAYTQIYFPKVKNVSLQEISRANLISVLGDEYAEKVNQLKKVRLKDVKDLVKVYNTDHPLEDVSS